jgi:hypothetical protein
MAAPETLPRLSASASASSTQIPPRAMLRAITPSFIFAISAAPSMPCVSSVSGVCTVMTSARASSSSSETRCAPAPSNAVTAMYGS